ncbi:MAG: efflux RND transporter permease subunit [Planctomycetes bacterium]|nr:efflux RND transporter permease subunit [Planctomycetota bacterium]
MGQPIVAIPFGARSGARHNSIGILVDQAIVMTENATPDLKLHFVDKPVTGDIRASVIEPCRTVGRPIFFSVLIMLLSFVPVFRLTGREGKPSAL